MDLNFIPFQLGGHFEKWEFELEPYKNYKYIDEYTHINGHLFTVVGFAVKTIYLGFNADVLYQIKIEFQTNNLAKEHIYLMSNIEQKLGLGEYVFEEENSSITKQWKEGKITLKVSLNLTTKTLSITVAELIELY